VNDIVKFIVLLCAIIVGALSLSSVCPDLHLSLFHGDEGCSHASTKDPSESGKSRGGESDESETSCAVVLFGQGLEVQSHYQISAFTGDNSNAKFSTVQLIWTSCKHDSFGARDPPVQA